MSPFRMAAEAELQPWYIGLMDTHVVISVSKLQKKFSAITTYK